MTAIKQWCFNFLAISVICITVSILMPNGNLEKISKTLINLIVFCSLFLGIKKIERFKLPEKSTSYAYDIDKNSENLIKKIEHQAIELAEVKIEKDIYNMLLEHGINANRVKIVMDTRSDKSISIKESEILLPYTDERIKENAKSIVDNYLNMRITKVKVCDVN